METRLYTKMVDRIKQFSGSQISLTMCHQAFTTLTETIFIQRRVLMIMIHVYAKYFVYRYCVWKSKTKKINST